MTAQFQLVTSSFLAVCALSACSTKKAAAPAAGPSAGAPADVQASANAAAAAAAATPAPAAAVSSAGPQAVVPAPSPSGASTTLTYYSRIQTVFATKCVPCHYAGAQAPDFSTPAGATANAAAAAAAIASGKMPPAKNLGPTDAADLASWARGGAPLGSAVTTPATAPATVKTILDTRCVPCHYPGGQDPDLSTLASAQAQGIHLALGVAVLQKMPPAKNCSQQEIATLTSWSVGGTPASGYSGGTP